MLGAEKEMFIPYLFKNKKYVISKRNYLCDYSKVKHSKIDMTLSGKFLAVREKFSVSDNEFDTYPSNIQIKKLKDIIRKDVRNSGKIILGSGANGILQNIVKILFKEKGNLVTPFYTFEQVEFAVTSFGGCTKRVYTRDYNIDFENLKKAIDKKTKMIYICNPNNPTGIYVDSNVILNFAKSVKIPVVVDESGIEFANKTSLLDYCTLPKNLIVVRSFSKAYGIANLRVGYFVCNDDFEKEYMKNVTTIEISGISYEIAIELLKRRKHETLENIDCIINERKKLVKQINELGIECTESDSNIVMTKTPFNENFFGQLKKYEISIVKVYDEFGKIHMRIAIQNEKTNKEFIRTLSTIMSNCNNIK